MRQHTPSQNLAVNTDGAVVACVAGPGSGKTSVLVARVARLVDEGVDPARIAVMTFTNAAASNLRERIGYEAGAAGKKFPGLLGYCGTLHSFALRALREHGAPLGYGERLAVLDGEAAAEMLASKARALGCKTPEKRLLELKAAGRPLRDKSVPLTVEQTVVAAYYDELLENGIVDLECLLPEFCRLLREVPAALAGRFDHLLVDEVQDSSAQDWVIYDAFPAPNKFFVGDPDQAIYAFRGGRQDLFLRLLRRGDAKVVKLEENFRCATLICRAANQLVRHNFGREDKRTFPPRVEPAGIVTRCGYATEGEEVGQVLTRIRALMTDPDPVDPSAIAVLARTNAIAAPFRDALKAAGVPVAAPPRTEAPPDWALARALVELLACPDNDALAFFYVAARERRRGSTGKEAAAKAHSVRQEASRARKSVNALWFNLPRDPGPTDLARLLEREGLSAETRYRVAGMAAKLPRGAGVLELAADMAGHFHEDAGEAGVTVGTVHAAKGREWDHVFLVGYEDEATPGNTLSRDVEEEERRLAFVGLTRARSAAHFTYAAQRRASWGRKEVLNRTPSRFIGEALV